MSNKLAAALGVAVALDGLGPYGFAPGGAVDPAVTPVLRVLYGLPSGIVGVLVLRRIAPARHH